MTDRLSYGATEDRTMPAVTYALYLLAMCTGFTAIIGVILAYANQGAAAARTAPAQRPASIPCSRPATSRRRCRQSWRAT